MLVLAAYPPEEALYNLILMLKSYQDQPFAFKHTVMLLSATEEMHIERILSESLKYSANKGKPFQF